MPNPLATLALRLSRGVGVAAGPAYPWVGYLMAYESLVGAVLMFALDVVKDDKKTAPTEVKEIKKERGADTPNKGFYPKL